MLAIIDRQAVLACEVGVAQVVRRQTTPKKTGLDRKLISLTEPHEVRSWTQALDCTEAELQAAVKAVGHSAEKVREYLKKK